MHGPSVARLGKQRDPGAMSDADDGHPIGVVTSADGPRRDPRLGVGDRPVPPPRNPKRSTELTPSHVTAGVLAAASAWSGLLHDVGVGEFDGRRFLHSQVALDDGVRYGGQCCCPEARWAARMGGNSSKKKESKRRR